MYIQCDPMAKTSAFRIRVEPELHRQFVDACKRLDKPAAQILREYMRSFVSRYQNTAQADLFDEINSK